LLFLKNNKESFSLFKNIVLILATGFSLGAFLAIKIGFFAIIIIITDIIILIKNKKLPYFLSIMSCSFIFYCFTYLPFFIHGHNFIEFLKVQKWMINFYFISKVKALIGMPFISLAFGYYKNWSDGSIFNRVAEWTILWPFYLIAILVTVKNFVKNKIDLKNDSTYVLFLTFGFFSLFIVIPFWVRYLVMIIPFMIIYLVGLIPKINKKIILILLFIYIFQVTTYLFQPLQQNDLNGIAKAWEKGIYQDLYNQIDNSTKKSLSRQQFWRSNQQFDRDLGIIYKKIEIKKLSKFWQYPQIVDIKIDYQTPIVTYNDKYKTEFIKENGQWKIKWNYYPGIAKSKYVNGSYGKLITDDGQIISEGGKRPFYSVTISKIKDEDLLQRQLLYLTGLKKYDVELKYKANNQIDWSADIDFLREPLTIDSTKTQMLDPGIQSNTRKTRVYNSLVYKNKKIFKFIEKKQSLLLPVLNPTFGGNIKITNNNKIKYWFSKEPENGKDVILKGIHLR